MLVKNAVVHALGVPVYYEPLSTAGNVTDLSFAHPRNIPSSDVCCVIPLSNSIIVGSVTVSKFVKFLKNYYMLNKYMSRII